MGLRETKKEQTRERLLEIAESRFRTQGFESTSIRGIATDAQVSVQTLYNYFPSKEGILAAIAADRFHAMAEGAERVRLEYLENDDAEGAPVEKFLHLVKWGLRGIAKDREFMGLVFLNARAVLFRPVLGRDHPASTESLAASTVSAELQSRQVENDEVLLRMFAGMQKAGAIAPGYAPSEIADLYILIFTDRVARWLDDSASTLEMLEASVLGGLKILFRGVAPEPVD